MTDSGTSLYDRHGPDWWGGSPCSISAAAAASWPKPWPSGVPL